MFVCLYTMPETAFLGAQIAPKSLTAGASPQTHWGSLQRSPRPSSWIREAILLRLLLLRGGEEGEEKEGRGGPRKIVHPEKFLRIGPGVVLKRSGGTPERRLRQRFIVT